MFNIQHLWSQLSQNICAKVDFIFIYCIYFCLARMKIHVLLYQV